MTCPRVGCRNTQCYICSKSCDYSHFENRGNGPSHCPLYDTFDRHDQEVKAAEEVAKKSVVEKNPEVDEERLAIKMSDRVAADDRARRIRTIRHNPDGYNPLPERRERFRDNIAAARLEAMALRRGVAPPHAERAQRAPHLRFMDRGLRPPYQPQQQQQQQQPAPAPAPAVEAVPPAPGPAPVKGAVPVAAGVPAPAVGQGRAQGPAQGTADVQLQGLARAKERVRARLRGRGEQALDGQFDEKEALGPTIECAGDPMPVPHQDFWHFGDFMVGGPAPDAWGDGQNVFGGHELPPFLDYPPGVAQQPIQPFYPPDHRPIWPGWFPPQPQGQNGIPHPPGLNHADPQGDPLAAAQANIYQQPQNDQCRPGNNEGQETGGAHWAHQHGAGAYAGIQLQPQGFPFGLGHEGVQGGGADVLLDEVAREAAPTREQRRVFNAQMHMCVNEHQNMAAGGMRTAAQLHIGAATQRISDFVHNRGARLVRGVRGQNGGPADRDGSGQDERAARRMNEFIQGTNTPFVPGARGPDFGFPVQVGGGGQRGATGGNMNGSRTA